MLLSVYVPGRPVPQGSLRSGGRGQLYWSNAAILRPYRANIVNAIRAAVPADHQSVAHGVTVDICFRTNRPKSHFLKSGALNPKAPRDLIVIPDYCDKGARAVLDAITDARCIYIDDCQVTDLHSRKRFATDVDPEGTYITISDEYL